MPLWSGIVGSTNSDNLVNIVSLIQLRLLSKKSYLMSLLCVCLAIFTYLTSFITEEHFNTSAAAKM